MRTFEAALNIKEINAIKEDMQLAISLIKKYIEWKPFTSPYRYSIGKFQEKEIAPGKKVSYKYFTDGCLGEFYSRGSIWDRAKQQSEELGDELTKHTHYPYKIESNEVVNHGFTGKIKISIADSYIREEIECMRKHADKYSDDYIEKWKQEIKAIYITLKI